LQSRRVALAVVAFASRVAGGKAPAAASEPANMSIVEYETIIPAPLDRVWDYLHADPGTALVALTPPAAKLSVERIEPMPVAVGTRLFLSVDVPLRGRVRWVAKYVEYRPPHAVVFGREGRFIDEQESGPFKSWRHEHEFEAMDDRSTRLRDRITYRVGLGPVGWGLDLLFVRRRIVGLLHDRKAALAEMFASPG
jgi:ligand-binding SRPBCC domain-containing protein